MASSLWAGGTNTTAGPDNSRISTPGTGFAGIGGTGGASMIVFGTIAGGAGAALTGGNFWQGAATGLIVSGLNHAMHNMEEVAQEQQESTQNSDCPDCPKNESLVKHNSSDGNTYSFERGSWRLVGQTTSIERFADKGPTLRQADNSGSTPS